jgi:hypothetical protein
LIIDYWLLIIDYWLLIIDYWLLIIDYWLLIIGPIDHETTKSQIYPTEATILYEIVKNRKNRKNRKKSFDIVQMQVIHI